MNVPVYFDKDEELAISLHGAIAQGEAENKCENIKWSLKKAAQNPDAQIYNRKCYGYSNAEDGSLVINEPEAEGIRQIFQMYLDGYSAGRILSSLKFRFPVFFNEQELYELDWDNESTVESVLLMRRAKR